MDPELQIGWDGRIGGCASCSDGKPEVECDGCRAFVCHSCWAEHNEDPDEVITKEQFLLWVKMMFDYPNPKTVPPEWRRN